MTIPKSHTTSNINKKKMKIFNHIKQTKKKVFITLGFLLILIYGYKSYKVVNSELDTSADFSSYHTFAWLPDKDNSTNNHDSIIHNNIKNYLSHHFEDFGYKIDTENPDLLFEQVITIANKTREYTDQHPVTQINNYQKEIHITPLLPILIATIIINNTIIITKIRII